MRALVVVENIERLPLEIPGVQVVSAKDYLISPDPTWKARSVVFNLCRTYSYQTTGYYVSLLAAARGHRPLPSVSTLQDMRLRAVLRGVSDDLDELIQKSLKPLRGTEFQLSIYFGRNPTERYARLAQALFNHFPAPLLRASFVKTSEWRLEKLRPVATSEIPPGHLDFVIERASAYLSRPPRRSRKRSARYDLAILRNPEEEEPPSDDAAIRKFVRAARELDMEAWVIHPDEYGRLAEYDGLFIRETTSVDHHTFRFARRAAAEGMVVIDDPESILRCTNKVFLAEIFARCGIPRPRTLVIDSDDPKPVEQAVGFPCVIKQPDSAFSRGVVRADSADELHLRLREVLEESELALVQEFLVSDYDWRVGVLEGRPLYACKYHMARGHWQIIQRAGDQRTRYGRVEPFPLEEVPANVVDLAVRSAALMGQGLYGVDLKTVGKRTVVVEVNDNPSLDAGYEDKLIGDALYDSIMAYFRRKLDERGALE